LDEKKGPGVYEVWWTRHLPILDTERQEHVQQQQQEERSIPVVVKKSSKEYVCKTLQRQFVKGLEIVVLPTIDNSFKRPSPFLTSFIIIIDLLPSENHGVL